MDIKCPQCGYIISEPKQFRCPRCNQNLLETFHQCYRCGKCKRKKSINKQT